MNPNNTTNEILTVDIGNELSKDITIHKNINQEIIITTSDKIELVLVKTKEVLTSQRDWWTPFGLLISFVATLTTADFKESLGLSKEFWHAIFILLSLGSGIWLLKSFYRLYKNWGEDDMSKIIKQIKIKSTSDIS